MGLLRSETTGWSLIDNFCQASLLRLNYFIVLMEGWKERSAETMEDRNEWLVETIEDWRWRLVETMEDRNECLVETIEDWREHFAVKKEDGMEHFCCA